MSNASLATSAVETIFNCEGSTPLNITLRAREFWVERKSSLGVQSALFLGTVFSSASVLVDGFHPCGTDLHAFLSIDFMKSCIPAF